MILRFLLFLALSNTFFLATITGIEVAKTDNNFLTFVFFLRILVGVMALFFTLKKFDLEDIFFFFLGVMLKLITKES